MASVLAQETIVGNVSRVYEKRVVGSDKKSVIDFNVAVTPRKMQDGEWVDAETYWALVTAWGRLADNIEDSFRQGDRVFVIGRKSVKPGFTRNDGTEAPPRDIIIADFAGLEVGYHPAHSDRVVKSDSSPAARPAAASKPASESKPVPKDDIFSSDDDDLDFSLDDSSDEPPF